MHSWSTPLLSITINPRCLETLIMKRKLRAVPPIQSYDATFINTDLVSHNSLQNRSFTNYGAENVSVVLQFRDSPQIWAGNMLSRGSVIFSPTDSISLTNVVGMTSRAISADSGVLCYNTNVCREQTSNVLF